MSSVFYLRFSKVALVAMVALFALLVTFNNIVDYSSNFEFVRHVLMMDTIFENSVLVRRSIDNPVIHHALYWIIIATEGTVGLLCAVGSIRMFKMIKANNNQFFDAKLSATVGLVLGIALWFSGFLTIGGEWFVMWQSEVWNGQDSAFKFIAILAFVLIFLHQAEPDCG